MRNWTKTAGMLFMAASAVYSGQWIVAATGPSVPPSDPKAAEAKPVDNSIDSNDPFASAPSTQPSDAPATQPAKSAPQSVTASQVNVNDAGTVEIHVNDANLVEVLRMLSLQSQKNIIASKEVRGSVTANLYDVTVKEALDAILHANGYDYREKGNFIYVYTTKEIQDMERAAQVKKTEVFRLYYTPAANAVNMIKPVLSTEGQVAFTTPAKAGIDENKDVGGNDHATEDILVVTDFDQNLEKVRRVLKEIDHKPEQVLVEATILRASLNENNALGIDFTVLGGVDFSTLSSVTASGTTSGGTSGGPTNGGTSGTPGTPGSGSSSNSGVTDALTGNIVDNPSAGHVVNKGYVASKFGGSGLTLGIVTHNVGIFLQALEGVTDTTVLANPKVLVLNKQKGEVHVGSELGYKTAVATETLTASDVKFLETGTRLIFRPYVGDNGNIRMEIHPEDSSGSVNDQGLPNKDSTEVTSNIMVKDGHTIVIGGLFRDSTTRTRSQVPFLGSLPGIGPLFRKQADATVREEIIILLTPHIIKDESAYAAAGEEELKYAERVRVGARRGLMPWGRERLAEAWYENAVREMNKPNPDRKLALWHLNCATNLNPMFSEAMELKAQITGKEVTAADNSTIKSFVRKQIMAERASGAEAPSSPEMVPVDVTPATQPSHGPATQAVQAPSAKQPADQAAAPATQPAQSDDVAGVHFRYPSQGNQQVENPSDSTVTAVPEDVVEDAPTPTDEKK